MPDVVVISGDTAGVGRAVARRFARRGAKVAILARERDELRSAAVEVVTLGASAALGIPCDVEDAAQLDAATRRIEQELGPIDLWIDTAVQKRPVNYRFALAAAAIGMLALIVIARRALR
ncbi:MAG TPA: SDR family NAD(P)-dependent oxidoreductase [Kofleriaceae bacterium]